MKFPSLNTLLVAAWVAVNASALVSIGSAYIDIAPHSGSWISEDYRQTIQFFAGSIPQEKLEASLMERDEAKIRDLFRQFFSVLNLWSCITLLNVLLTIGYFYRVRRNSFPRSQTPSGNAS